MKILLRQCLFYRDEWNEAVRILNHWMAHLETVSSLDALEFCRSLKQQSQHVFR
jgi:hypothetical protein